MTDKKNVLIFRINTLSSAIIDRLNASSKIGNIYTISSGENSFLKRINLGRGDEIRNIECKNLIKEKSIDFLIIFSEHYSYAGLVDYYKKAAPVIGITKEWFKLESSKISGKNFMLENGIKTPPFMIIKNKQDIKNALEAFNLPIIVKNNFLQKGFGTYICRNISEYKKICKSLLKDYKICIAEKFIISEAEITQHYIWDTKNLIPLNPVKDYKRLKENNQGINTGSLGSYTPVFLTDKQYRMLNQYNKQMEIIFESIKPDFTGIFCTNVMFCDDDLYTLEFNMRPRIPEFQTLLENMDIDILDFFSKIANKRAKDINIEYKEGTTGCVVAVHKDYYKQTKHKSVTFQLRELLTGDSKGIKIYLDADNLDKDYQYENETNRKLFTLSNTDKNNPFEKIYKFINTINTKDLYYRKDIGD